MLLVALFGVVALSKAASGQSVQESAHAGWEVLLVQYASSESVPRSRWTQSAGDPQAAAMSWHFAVLRRASQTVLIDCGTDRFADRPEVRARWNVVWWRSVTESLASAGITVEEVSHLILTHHHWDHAGAVSLFPNARVIIHRAEWARLPRRARRELRRRGAVDLWSSEAPLSGITVTRSGRHTRGSLMVRVSCRQRALVFVGDAVYFRSQLRELNPHSSLARLLVSENSIEVLPGHDPGVFLGFPQVGERVARICQP